MIDIALVVISGLAAAAAIWLAMSLWVLAAWHYRSSRHQPAASAGTLSSASEAHLQDIRRLVAEIGTQVDLRRLRPVEDQAQS